VIQAPAHPAFNDRRGRVRQPENLAGSAASYFFLPAFFLPFFFAFFAIVQSPDMGS
jgi:hypothetical protein